jgi:hypothetical protein
VRREAEPLIELVPSRPARGDARYIVWSAHPVELDG